MHKRTNAIIGSVLTAFVLVGIVYVASPRFLQGSLLSDSDIAQNLKHRADTNNDGVLTAREIRKELFKIIRGVILHSSTEDINGDGIVDRLDMSATVTGFRALLNAVCGNSVVDAGEQCDDGNTANDDGCTALCQTLPASEFACSDGIDNDADGRIDTPGAMSHIDEASPQTSFPSSVIGSYGPYVGVDYLTTYNNRSVFLEHSRFQNSETFVLDYAFDLVILDTLGQSSAIRLPLRRSEVAEGGLVVYQYLDEPRGVLYLLLSYQADYQPTELHYHLLKIDLSGTPTIMAEYNHESEVDRVAMINFHLNSDSTLLHVFSAGQMFNASNQLRLVSTMTTFRTDTMTVIREQVLSDLPKITFSGPFIPDVGITSVEHAVGDVDYLLGSKELREFNVVTGQTLRTYPLEEGHFLYIFEYDASTRKFFLVTHTTSGNFKFTIFDAQTFQPVASGFPPPPVAPYDRTYMQRIIVFDGQLDLAYVTINYANGGQTSNDIYLKLVQQGSALYVAEQGENLLDRYLGLYDQQSHTLYGMHYYSTEEGRIFISKNLKTGLTYEKTLSSFLPPYSHVPPGSLWYPALSPPVGHSLFFVPQWRRNLVPGPPFYDQRYELFLGSPIKINLGDAECSGPTDTSESE